MKSNEKVKSLLLSVLVALALAGITFAVSALFGRLTPDFENRQESSILSSILSYVFFIVACAVCILLRKFKKAIVLRGIVIYLLIGLLAFVIHFLILLAGEESFLLSGSSLIYYLWTLPLHEGSLLAIRLFHFPVRYIMAFLYAFISFVAIKSLHGIKLDREFEAKIKEKHDLESQS